MIPYRRVNLNKKHPLYWIYNSMFVRCYYPSHKNYKDYGGRGIEVHGLFYDFEFFTTCIEGTIGKRPSMKHSLDRIDNDKGYQPFNLRWATKKQQRRNRRHANG